MAIVELGCGCHTANDAIISYGPALVDDDPGRFGMVEFLLLAKVFMVRIGPFRRQEFSTQIVPALLRPGAHSTKVAGHLLERVKPSFGLLGLAHHNHTTLTSEVPP